MPALRRRPTALPHEHLRLYVLLLEEAVEAGFLLVGRREGLPMGMHGLRRRPLLPRPAAGGRRGVPLRAEPGTRAGRVSRDHQALISIGYLDGNRLCRAVIAGAHFVAERAEPLNKINVFPVADGDTGTNIASTLQKVAAGISRLRQRHLRKM